MERSDGKNITLHSAMTSNILFVASLLTALTPHRRLMQALGLCLMCMVVYEGRGRAVERTCNPYQSGLYSSPDHCGSEWTESKMALWNSLGWGAFGVGLAMVVVGEGDGRGGGGWKEGWVWRMGARVR